MNMPICKGTMAKWQMNGHPVLLSESPPCHRKETSPFGFRLLKLFTHTHTNTHNPYLRYTRSQASVWCHYYLQDWCHNVYMLWNHEDSLLGKYLTFYRTEQVRWDWLLPTPPHCSHHTHHEGACQTARKLTMHNWASPGKSGWYSFQQRSHLQPTPAPEARADCRGIVEGMKTLGF